MGGETAMSNYEKIASAFSDKPLFTRSEFTDYIRTCNPTLKENSFGWLLYDLCRKRIIEHIAYNVYRVNTGESSLREYESVLSDEASGILELVRKKFPLVTYVVWETRAYNEFANHQLARNLIFIETEKLLCESVFNAVHEQGDYVALCKPSEKEIALYSGDVTVCVLPLTTEAPIISHKVTLEKLLVDLFANKLLAQIISRGDFAGIYEEAFSRYKINYNVIQRYAKRRNKADEIKRFIVQKTDITAHGKDNNND